MNRPHVQERYHNAQSLQRFYLQVLEYFVVLLEKEYRYKPHVHQEHIDEIQKIVRERLSFSNKGSDKSKERFERYLSMKQSSQREILHKQEIDPDSNFSKDKATVSQYNLEQLPKSEAVKQEDYKPEEQEDSFDDLELIQQDLNLKDKGLQEDPFRKQVKKQERCLSVLPSVKKEDKYADSMIRYGAEDQSDSSQSEGEDNFMEIVNRRIGTSLVSTFTPFQVKRKPKQEKIFIQLQNVFVKFINYPFENYFARVNCELTKVEKENIKITDR